MELRLELSDDMQATEPVKRHRAVPVYALTQPLSKSEWIRVQRLLLAQALAISFYILIIREVKGRQALA